jgi:DNA-binding XRE family transcriptional regulator
MRTTQTFLWHIMKSPLRRARETAGQTIVEVGRAVGVDAGNLSRIENSKQKASTELAEKLAKHFGGLITELEILYPERSEATT